jgi:hypothetical protein
LTEYVPGATLKLYEDSVAGEVLVAGDGEMTAPGFVNEVPFSAVFDPEIVPLHDGSIVHAARELLHTPAQEPWLGQTRGGPPTQVPLMQVSPVVQ